MKVRHAFGQNLRTLRRRRGLSQRGLADAMREHNDGDPLGLEAPELSLIERGLRGVTLEQWLLLAAGLDCPPVLLIAPLGTTETLEVTRRSNIHPHLALRWIVGEEALATTERRVIRRADWLRMQQPLQLYRRLAEAQEAVRADNPGLALPDDKAATVYEQLADVLTDMAVADVRPPEFSPWTVGRLAQFGWPPDQLGIRPFMPADWYRDHGEETPLRHPDLPYALAIPADLVDDYLQGGWHHE